MPDTTPTARSVRLAADEARRLTAAPSQGAVGQNDLLGVGVQRVRQELGAASRIKPEAIVATAQASGYQLASPPAGADRRAAAAKPSAPARPAEATGSGRAVRRPSVRCARTS
jgi:hypothetical protein